MNIRPRFRGKIHKLARRSSSLPLKRRCWVLYRHPFVEFASLRQRRLDWLERVHPCVYQKNLKAAGF